MFFLGKAEKSKKVTSIPHEKLDKLFSLKQGVRRQEKPIILQNIRKFDGVRRNQENIRMIGHGFLRVWTPDPRGIFPMMSGG